MRRLRFTIGGLLVVILFVAFAVAALRESTEIWAAVVFSTTLLALSAAIVLAVHRAGRKRAFWLGFSIFGWTYFLASVIPTIDSRLFTTQALSYLDSKIPKRDGVFLENYYRQLYKTAVITASASSTNFSAATPIVGSQSQSVSPRWKAARIRLWTTGNGSTENFLKIGHGVLALIVAIAGGCFSRTLARRATDEADTDRSRSELAAAALSLHLNPESPGAGGVS